MTTKKLYIKHCEEVGFIKEKQTNYSYAFRRLYKMLEESADENFICEFKKTFSLNDMEYCSLVSDVKSFKKREQEEWDSKKKTVEKLNEKLKDDKLTKRKRFKILRRIAKLSSGIGRESTFGGRYLQKCITRECNKKTRDSEKINRLKKEFNDNRILPFMIVGEANQKGNRFFDLCSLSEKVITYKPSRGIKIRIDVNIPKGWEKDLSKLSDMSKNKEIAVTVRLSDKYIHLTYDEEHLSGYSVDEVSRRASVKEIKLMHHPKEIESGLIKKVYNEFYDRQRECKIRGKLKNRCMAIDMNPTCVGFSITEFGANDTLKIIHKGLIDLSGICKKSGRKTSDDYSKYLCNKRRYEVTVIVKKLFKIALQYKCSSFVIEDLSIEGDLGREANRKVWNVWNRELFVNCITRRCNENGIELIKVNPCYSSFIGNIQYAFADACNASIEIGRRGLMKYEVGGFYPHITEEDIHTLEAKFGDVVDCSTDADWVNIYKSLKSSFDNEEFSHRLRAGLDEVKTSYEVFSMNSSKSKVKIIIFN